MSSCILVSHSSSLAFDDPPISDELQHIQESKSSQLDMASHLKEMANKNIGTTVPILIRNGLPQSQQDW